MNQQSITLSESDFYTLKSLDIGQRVRYIREVLKGNLGGSYSSRSVATRIGVISTAALASIERGDTKDPAAKVIYAISKDFNLDIAVFFDDYYTSEPKEISIKVADTKVRLNQTDDNEPSVTKFGICLYEENSRGDRRMFYSILIDRNFDYLNKMRFISETLNIIDAYTFELDESLEKAHPLLQSKEYINKVDKYPLAFPWMPKYIWEEKWDQMFNIAQKHTKEHYMNQ